MVGLGSDDDGTCCCGIVDGATGLKKPKFAEPFALAMRSAGGALCGEDMTGTTTPGGGMLPVDGSIILGSQM